MLLTVAPPGGILANIYVIVSSNRQEFTKAPSASCHLTGHDDPGRRTEPGPWTPLAATSWLRARRIAIRDPKSRWSSLLPRRQGGVLFQLRLWGARKRLSQI